MSVVASCRGSIARRRFAPTAASALVLEGGGIETNGAGAMLVTEEWLLSDVQVRNPGLDARRTTSTPSSTTSASRSTIWLGEGCVGDDTHGHIDDIARFARPSVRSCSRTRTIRPTTNHARSVDNLRRLELAARDWPGGLRVVKLPYPRPVTMNGERLPASYANFYIANGVVHRADVQRPQRPRRAQHARGAVSGARGGRHPRGRSRVGAGDAALSHAAAAEGGVSSVRGRQCTLVTWTSPSVEW